MALIFLQALALTAFFVNRALGTDFLSLSAPPIGAPLVWIGSAEIRRAHRLVNEGLADDARRVWRWTARGGKALRRGKYRPADFFCYTKIKKCCSNDTEYRTYCAIF